MNRQIDSQKTSKQGERAETQSRQDDSMDRERRIAQEVQETLRCFDEDQSIQESPRFLAGVEKKIRSLAPAPRTTVLAAFRRKVLVPAVLIAMVILNIVTAVFVTRMKKTASETKQKGISALAEQYAAYQAGYASYLK